MQKKILGIMMSVMMAAATMTAGCGSSSDSAEAESTSSYSESAETSYDESATEDAGSESAVSASSTGFSLNDVTSDMISSAVYAQNSDGDELVFATYQAPSGNTYATLVDATNGDLWTIPVTSDGSSTEDVTTEDGSTVSLTSFSGDDVYTGNAVVIGFAEPGDGTCYIYDTNGNVYAGQELSADDAITYLGSAISVAGQQ